MNIIYAGQTINVDNIRQYKLTSYKNFVNVPFGAERGPPNGSKSNEAKARVAGGMIENWLAKGVVERSIDIMAAYSEQVALLEAMTERRGWRGIRVLMITKSQGGEFDILIITMVRTDKAYGFIGERSKPLAACCRFREAMYFIGHDKF